uniref:metal ABC transporter solute-binding protein, Zn/Mn family n=1 Tax=Aliarcobacter sp. TaxID=2321116 RepID=UPI00404788D3
MKKILFLMVAMFSLMNASTSQITVSILPQKYFVEKIVKDKFNVNVMVLPGFSPATYEPKSSQMKSLIESKVYFYIDAPFEKSWLNKFKQSSKKTLFVDTTIGIEKLAMEKHSHHEDEKKDKHNHDSHKNEHAHDDHEEEGLDPHVWLDPILVKEQIKVIYETMVKIDSSNENFYKTNYETFLNELDELDKKLKTILEPYDDKSFMVFHPSWGYFAKRYHLNQIAIEIQGKEPKPNELVTLIEEAKENNIKIVFVAPQFSQKSANTISKNINANVVNIDPLSEKWSESLIQTANEIANSYTK